MDELSAKFDNLLRDNTALKLTVNKLEIEVGQQKTAYEMQEKRIRELENENKTLRENQQKLIRENEQLTYKLETLQYAGKKKKPVPVRKDTPCSN